MSKIIPHSKPLVGEDEVKAVAEIIKSGMHASGKKTWEFEKKIADFVGLKYAKAVNSGTNALHIALLSLDIDESAEVILPSYVCSSVLSAVKYTRAKPVLADIDAEFDKRGYNISVRTIRHLINDKTKAIIVPHMFGFPAEIDKIISLGVPIIEDCAHSIGASYMGRMLGSFGKIAIFSFYATKMLSTGYGGMVATSDPKIMKRIEDLTKYDGRIEYKMSYNYSLSDIQSALGLKQLDKLKDFISRRRFIENKYNESFRDEMKIPPKNDGSFAFRYIVRFENKIRRDNAKEMLLERGIVSELPIFMPLHRYLNLKKERFISSDEAYDTGLSTPLYPALTNKEIGYVIKSVLEAV